MVIYLSMSDGSRVEVRGAVTADVVDRLVVCRDKEGTVVASFDSNSAGLYGSYAPDTTSVGAPARVTVNSS